MAAAAAEEVSVGVKPDRMEVPMPATLEPARAGSEPGQRILSEIAASLSTEDDLEALLQPFRGTIDQICGAGAGAARVLTADGTRLRLVGSVGLPADVLEREALVDAGCGPCGGAARHDRIEEIADVDVCAERTSCAYFGRECTSVFAVPLCHRGRMLGVYNLFFGAHQRIGPETLSLLRSIGELLGLA